MSVLALRHFEQQHRNQRRYNKARRQRIEEIHLPTVQKRLQQGRNKVLQSAVASTSSRISPFPSESG